MTIKWSELSDRERDVLVAEYVTKLELYKGVGYFDLPHYTTSIADAWEVIEKLGYAFDICSVRSGFEVSFQWEDQYRKKYSCSTAPTVPEAIAIAALKAVGVDVE